VVLIVGREFGSRIGARSCNLCCRRIGTSQRQTSGDANERSRA
jgi:hypothetical protein